MFRNQTTKILKITCKNLLKNNSKAVFQALPQDHRRGVFFRVKTLHLSGLFIQT